MSIKTWKVCGTCLAAVCALGLVALATPGLNITTTIVAGPSLLEEGKINEKSEINKVKLQFEGFDAPAP